MSTQSEPTKRERMKTPRLYSKNQHDSVFNGKIPLFESSHSFCEFHMKLTSRKVRPIHFIWSPSSTLSVGLALDCDSSAYHDHRLSGFGARILPVSGHLPANLCPFSGCHECEGFNGEVCSSKLHSVGKLAQTKYDRRMNSAELAVQSASN